MERPKLLDNLNWHITLCVPDKQAIERYIKWLEAENAALRAFRIRVYNLYPLDMAEYDDEELLHMLQQTIARGGGAEDET